VIKPELRASKIVEDLALYPFRDCEPHSCRLSKTRDLPRLQPANTNILQRQPDLDNPEQGSALERAGIAALRFVDRSPRRTFEQSRKPSATTARPADGPLYMGKDTHALSGPQCTALEVLAANTDDERTHRSILQERAH
jgi:hypothetical protein